MQMMNKENKENQAISLTDRLRGWSQPVLGRIADALLSLGLTPNAATVIGCLGNVVAGVLIAMGYLTWGGLVALFWVLFDALDGTMARRSNTVSALGGFLDSTLDRMVEFFLFTALGWYFMQQAQPLGVLLTFITMAGCLITSYARAKAEAVQFTCKVGILTRMERFFIFIPSLVFQVPLIGIATLALLSQITVLQRIITVVKQAKQQP
jgi:CDP-diacylglycerol---glycerol-3-phosphate 3-phosphatidyltransferase